MRKRFRDRASLAKNSNDTAYKMSYCWKHSYEIVQFFPELLKKVQPNLLRMLALRRIQVSISPTFYKILYIRLRFELLLAQEYWRKCAYKMLVKLTTGLSFINLEIATFCMKFLWNAFFLEWLLIISSFVKCWWNWLQLSRLHRSSVLQVSNRSLEDRKPRRIRVKRKQERGESFNHNSNWKFLRTVIEFGRDIKAENFKIDTIVR